MFGQSINKHGDNNGATNGGQPDFTAAVNDLTTPVPTPNGAPTQAWGHPVGPPQGAKIFTPTNTPAPEPQEPPQPRDIEKPNPPSDNPGRPIPAPHESSTPPSSTTNTASDLSDIKQKALSKLSPLVQHLDQTPEEKFSIIMMMIQASDDQDLLKTAYEIAETITDEKIRAQALLDVVNEINYFTQARQQG